MAKKSKKRTKQCCTCVAKNSEAELRGQVRGRRGAGNWLSEKVILLQVLFSLKSLWDTVQHTLCSFV